jgi:hypothetical protein
MHNLASVCLHLIAVKLMVRLPTIIYVYAAQIHAHHHPACTVTCPTINVQLWPFLIALQLTVRWLTMVQVAHVGVLLAQKV